MSKTVFRSTSFTLRHLVDNIDRGDVALPELQRPFAWSNSKVRDLFDSMYQGFPTGGPATTGLDPRRVPFGERGGSGASRVTDEASV